MDIERRTFLRCAAAAALVLIGPVVPRAATADGSIRYLSACQLPDGSYAVAEFDPDGLVVRTIPMPNRGHGFAVSADRSRAVAFSRHPYTFAMAFDVGGSDAPVAFAAPEGRHFYGHGIFADSGRLLLATENDYDNARGVVGVYDVGAGYRRIGEFETGGVGPHEVVMMPDGRTVALANGGIETHPDAGDMKLNLPTMQPSLIFLDARTGDVLVEHRLDASLHQLSIRHLAVDAGGLVWFGCQYEGSATDQPPLLGRASPDAAPAMIDEGAGLRLQLKNYIGSVSATVDGDVIAASSPVGGQLVFVRRDGTVLGAQPLADGCGLAPLGDDHHFIATSGEGAVVDVDATTNGPLATDALSFDNHIARVIPA